MVADNTAAIFFIILKKWVIIALTVNMYSGAYHKVICLASCRCRAFLKIPQVPLA